MFKKETRKIIKMQLSELLVLVRGSGDMITCLPGIIGTDKIRSIRPHKNIKKTTFAVPAILKYPKWNPAFSFTYFHTSTHSKKAVVV